MKAIIQDRYGEAGEVLRLAEVDRPAPGPDEVLVRVRAAGVDRGVWHVMTGRPYLIRLMGYGLRVPKNPVRGAEFAGRIEAVGANVTGLQVGDDAYGIGEGSFAEFVRAKAGKVAPMPKNLTYEQAAAAPISALSALQAVRDKAQVRAGQQVLVIGASGGVGSFAVQIAKAYGATVTGVASTAKLDLVRSLGAEHVVDYTRESIADAGRRYDVIIDTGGNRPLRQLRKALTPRGTLVIVGAETGGRWLGGSHRLLLTPLLSLFVRQKLSTLVSSENARDLVAMCELIESGEVTPAIDRTYPLDQSAEAVQYMTDGHARGKVVVTT